MHGHILHGMRATLPLSGPTTRSKIA
jgi:hypothetical protein